jgi:hypothetical protein
MPNFEQRILNPEPEKTPEDLIVEAAKELAILGSKITEFNDGKTPESTTDAMRIAQKHGLEYKYNSAA